VAPKTARQLGLLAVLLVVLVVVVTYNRDDLPREPAARPMTRAAAARAAAGQGDVGVVSMPALAAARPGPDVGARNPFRFRPAAPPPSAQVARRPAGPVDAAGAVMPAMPSGPPPLPPITLKFIGVVEQSARMKLAVLSDGRNILYGKEGDTIEGRYRIERIGPESIDMAYLDGRGRQTLRLSGS
jgi:hypothetical protein